MKTPFSDGALDLVSTPSQGVVQTHGEAVCAGSTCVIHNPSAHHMRYWEIRFERAEWYLAYRKCPKHSMEHPDPDSLAFLQEELVRQKVMDQEDVEYLGIHTCCGCCRRP